MQKEQVKLHRLIELKARAEHRQELIEMFQSRINSGTFSALDLADWIDAMQLQDATEYEQITSRQNATAGVAEALKA